MRQRLRGHRRLRQGTRHQRRQGHPVRQKDRLRCGSRPIGRTTPSSPRATARNWSGGGTSSSCAPIRRSFGARKTAALLWRDRRRIRAFVLGRRQMDVTRPVPEDFTIGWRELRFKLKLMGFKHTGLFPEQAVNWDRMSRLDQGRRREISVLNLFGYTGAASVACVAAGAACLPRRRRESDGGARGRERQALGTGRLRICATSWTTASSSRSGSCARTQIRRRHTRSRPASAEDRAARSGR